MKSKGSNFCGLFEKKNPYPPWQKLGILGGGGGGNGADKKWNVPIGKEVGKPQNFLGA